MQKILSYRLFSAPKWAGRIGLGLALGLTVAASCLATPVNAAAERSPLYRLYNARTGDHLFTASSSERAAAVTGGYVMEPSPGFLASADDAAKTALYRLYYPRTGEHFYTVNATERTSLAGHGWLAEGVAGEVGLES